MSLLRAVRALDLSLSMEGAELKPEESSLRRVQDKHGFKGVLGAPFLKRDVGCRLVPKPVIFCLGARHPAPGHGRQPTLLHCALAYRARKKRRKEKAFDEHLRGVVFSGFGIGTLTARHRVGRGATRASWGGFVSSVTVQGRGSVPPPDLPFQASSLRRSPRLAQSRCRLALPLTP